MCYFTCSIHYVCEWRKSLKKNFWRHKNKGWGEEEWERKPLKKGWIIPHFYDVTCWLFKATFFPHFTHTHQQGMIQWTVYYTSHQSIFNNVFLFVDWTTLGIFWILIGWFIELSVQTFQTKIVIYRWGNFVYHHWGCTSIYRRLS